MVQGFVFCVLQDAQDVVIMFVQVAISGTISTAQSAVLIPVKPVI
jgi:hypothetical protein